MKAALCFLLCLFLLSCSARNTRTLQPLKGPASSRKESLLQLCMATWPDGGWQFVHTIDFTVNNNRSGSLLGVTVVEKSGHLRCALLTMEGLPLFEARFTDKPEILRAVAPFDRPGFADGLMQDVQTLFTRPRIVHRRTGRTAQGREACRLINPDGLITEIIPVDRGCYDLRTYGKNGRLTRTVTARNCSVSDGLVLPRNLVLHASGPEDYTLTMTLVSADHLSPTSQP